MSTEQARLAIEVWWPHLSIDARHVVLRDMDAEFEASVVAEIAAIAAGAGWPEAMVPMRLDESERGYVLTQIEAVD